MLSKCTNGFELHLLWHARVVYPFPFTFSLQNANSTTETSAYPREWRLFCWQCCQRRGWSGRPWWCAPWSGSPCQAAGRTASRARPSRSPTGSCCWLAAAPARRANSDLSVIVCVFCVQMRKITGNTRHITVQHIVATSLPLLVRHGRTDGRTDRRTDGSTDTHTVIDN